MDERRHFATHLIGNSIQIIYNGREEALCNTFDRKLDINLRAGEMERERVIDTNFV